MSSESRNELLESLLSAKFDLRYCEDEDKAEMRARFERLLSDLIARHPQYSRNELLEAIQFKFVEYCAARIRAQRRRETL